MRNPSLTASPKQRQRRNTGDTRNLMVTPPVFRLPSLTAIDDWNARVDGGTYQISNLHPRQPLPAVIITPCTPEKKPPPSSLAFTPSSDGTSSSSVPTTPPTPQLPKITQPVFVNPGPEDDDEDIALKRVMEDLEYALIQRDKDDINPFDISPSPNYSKDPDPPSFNISQSLQISLSKQSQDSTCSSPDDASWDIPWESSSGKYMTSTPLLSWRGSVTQQEHEDPFTNPQNVIKSPPRRTSAPYMDLFDLDMYLEASLAINTTDLGVCSLEEDSENPFEDTFAIEPEPEPVVTVSPSENVAVPMNRSVKERDVYRPSGYTRSPRFRFSVDENGSPVPLPSQDQRCLRTTRVMTVVDQVRAVLDDESCDEEEEVGGDDNDTSEISMPALKARLREACRKSGATTGLGLTTSSLLTGHGASQRKSMPLLTGSPRASLAVASHSTLAASPHASLPAASLTPSQHASQSALRPTSRLLRDITNTMTTSTSSSSTSTLASIAHGPTTVQKNPFSVLTQNPIKSETRMTMQENPISTSIKLKTRNPIARFGRDIANIVVDDSANSVSLCGVNTAGGGENTTMASVYTSTSVYGGENTMGSVYSVQNTMGSVYTTTSMYAQNTTTDSDEAAARALKARLRQACDNLSKSVWVEECDTVQSWEPVPF